MEGRQHKKRLSENDRKYIEKMYKTKSNKEIAERLEVSATTISRELKRCKPGQYSAKLAQEDSRKKMNHSGMPVNRPIKSYWENLLMEKQIEVCFRMKPDVKEEEISQITGISLEYVRLYYPNVRTKVMTQ